jgi:DNA-binding Xre family transcriptional regulator
MMKLTVKETAEAKGFKNAKALADEAGIPYASLYKIYHGKSNTIGLITLNKLCKTLNVEVGLLIKYIPDEEPKRTGRKK